MFHSVVRILRWAKGYRRRMILGFVCSFFATWCTAGPVMLAAWALGRLIGNAWGENELSASLPWLCLGGIVVLILLRFLLPTGRTGSRRASARSGRRTSAWSWGMC